MTNEERAQLELITQELESQGVSSCRVSDGTVFFFKRAVIEELYNQFQQRPGLGEIQLMIYSDPTKMAAARGKNRN
jgi:hypothetical protein